MAGTASDTWVRMALAACVSMILTGTAAWFTFGANKITRTDMVEYVAEQNKIPTLRIDTNDAADKELRDTVTKLADSQQGLVVELRSFVAEMRAAK